MSNTIWTFKKCFSVCVCVYCVTHGGLGQSLEDLDVFMYEVHEVKLSNDQ